MAEYQLDFTPLSLRDLASIEVGKMLWKKPAIKRTLVTMMNDNVTRSRECIFLTFLFNYAREHENHKILVKHFIDDIEQLELPKTVKQYLVVVTKTVGYVIIEWLDKIYQSGIRLVELEEYLDHIKWTSLGIDTAETLRSMYYSKKLPICCETYVELCNNCLEDCIIDLFPKVGMALTGYLRSTRHEDFKRYELTFYWLEHTTKHFSFYRTSGLFSPITRDPQIRCFVSIMYNNYSTTKYFWNLLNFSERKNLLMKLMEFFEENNIKRTEDMSMDLIIFLWNQCVHYNVEGFIFNFISMNTPMIGKIAHWPWRQIIMRIVTKIFRINRYKLDYKMVINHLLTYLVSSIAKPISSNCIELFVMVWQQCPAVIKRSLSYKTIIQCLAIRNPPYIYSYKGVDLLSLVINDSAFGASYRYWFLQQSIEGLIWYDYYRDNLIDVFFNRFNCTEEEKEWVWARIRETLENESETEEMDLEIES